LYSMWVYTSRTYTVELSQWTRTTRRYLLLQIKRLQVNPDIEETDRFRTMNNLARKYLAEKPTEVEKLMRKALEIQGESKGGGLAHL
jgi:hypothetical protein